MTEAASSVHHINFLVRDLDQAEARYRELLGLPAAIREELPGRGVRTARFQLGETWLVLVQPTGEEGEPARQLREHGEGFFLISFGVDDLDQAVARARDAGVQFTSAEPRDGLLNWRIIDFDPAATFGAQLQLAEESDGS